MMKHTKFISGFILLLSILLLKSCSDDDSTRKLDKATVSFSDETYRIVESSEEPIRVPVGLDTPYHSGGTVQVTITGGVLGEDYNLDQPSNSFTINFSDTSVTQYFSITPVDDNRLNQDVELEIVLSEPTGSLKLGLVSFLQVILLDDEERLTAEVNFEPSTFEVIENDTLNIPVNFNNLSTDGGSITVVAGGGTAVYGEDYILEGADDDNQVTLTVDEYGDTASFNIIALDNDLFEENKTFNIQLLEVTGGISIASQNSIAEVTIIEDDAPPFTTIGFDASATAEADESISEVNLQLALSQLLEMATNVEITVDASSTATLGEDFTFINGSVDQPFILNLESGIDMSSLALLLTDDDMEEGDETIVLNLSSTDDNLVVDQANSSFTFIITDNEGTGGGSNEPLYVETFESYNSEETDFLIDNLNFERLILADQTMPDSEVISLINNSGSFSDLENVNGTSEDGLNIFTNTQNNTEFPVDGVIDNVIITPAIQNADGDLTINADISYAFKNQNSGVVRFYYSNTYNESGNWDESQWNLMGTETVPDLDAEGFGNNTYKREEFSINSTGTLYVAIRVTNQMSVDNYRYRFRFDNIKVSETN